MRTRSPKSRFIMVRIFKITALFKRCNSNQINMKYPNRSLKSPQSAFAKAAAPSNPQPTHSRIFAACRRGNVSFVCATEVGPRSVGCSFHHFFNNSGSFHAIVSPYFSLHLSLSPTPDRTFPSCLCRHAAASATAAAIIVVGRSVACMMHGGGREM